LKKLPIKNIVPSPSLSELAYLSIKEKILSMELRPGSFVNEIKLCEMTSLGRMPVHQAIHRLQIEGLIEVMPRKGIVICSDSLHDVLSLLEARLAMEPNVAALAAERISDEQIKHVKVLLKKSSLLLNQRQRDSFRVIDREFHAVLADAAGNKILADTQRPLHERSGIIWHLRIMPENGLEITQREHEAIFKAVIKRDAMGAKKAMETHLLSLQKRIIQASK